MGSMITQILLKKGPSTLLKNNLTVLERVICSLHIFYNETISTYYSCLPPLLLNSLMYKTLLYNSAILLHMSHMGIDTFKLWQYKGRRLFIELRTGNGIPPISSRRHYHVLKTARRRLRSLQAFNISFAHTAV